MKQNLENDLDVKIVTDLSLLLENFSAKFITGNFFRGFFSDENFKKRIVISLDIKTLTSPI